MRATLRLYAHSRLSLASSLHLKRVLDDAPPVLFPGVGVCLHVGGPVHKIKWTTYDPATRSLSVKLEDSLLPADPGARQDRLAELYAEGWEDDV
jgi:hypothetical protein